MSTVAFVALQPGVTLGATVSNIATATTASQLRLVTFANPTAAAVTLLVTITRSGSSAPQSVIPGKSVAPGTTSVAAELNGTVLANGDTVNASGAGLVAIINALTVSP